MTLLRSSFFKDPSKELLSNSSSKELLLKDVSGGPASRPGGRSSARPGGCPGVCPGGPRGCAHSLEKLAICSREGCLGLL